MKPQYHDQEDTEVPPALWCSIYAISLPFWNRSSELSRHPRPNVPYVWNLAVEALHEEFFAPSLATVSCATIDMIGRPIYSVMGNVINEGKTVSLAHVLGLNHDPASWRCSEDTKRSRIRAWWGVFVNSRWSSFAHGVPSGIAKDQYNVPLPTQSDLLTPGKYTEARINAAESFIRLCNLSQILGEALPTAYNLNRSKNDIGKQIRRINCDLGQWEADLPPEMRPTDNLSGNNDGTSNLWFCYLSTRLLLARASLRAVSENSLVASENRQYRLAMLRASAQEVVDFVASLSDAQFLEFWLPYTTHLLATAGMMLLRCTVELPGDDAVAKSCSGSLVALQLRLREARDNLEWDLADVFLNQCGEPISRLLGNDSDRPGQANGTKQTHENVDVTLDISGFPVDHLQLNVDTTDIDLSMGYPGYPYETLWNMLEFAGPT